MKHKNAGDNALNPSDPLAEPGSHSRIFSAPDQENCLDSIQLGRLEQAFRNWAEASPRSDVRKSRRRILIIFLLIRYTGAKLNEILNLNSSRDFDFEDQSVFLGGKGSEEETSPREVQLSAALTREMQQAVSDPEFRMAPDGNFGVDPGFVRKKFYERARECGFDKRLGGPEMIRKARAVEMLQNNMPLPVVQTILGHSTPNLTSSYVDFSQDEIRQVAKTFMERETSRRTSARNSFFGKIEEIQRGDIQARIRLSTISGHTITAMITNSSLERLALKTGRLVTAEVKAPWVILQKEDAEPQSSAENRIPGTISRITAGGLSSECAIRISDGTELCAVVSTPDCRRLGVQPGDRVWALFTCFAVVLHVG